MFDKLFFTKNGQISESRVCKCSDWKHCIARTEYRFRKPDACPALSSAACRFFSWCIPYGMDQAFFKTSVKIHWRQIVLIIEILILGITGFLPNEPTLNVIANIMLSFACAMQVDTFRKFRSIPCATTMCIGNMRSATEYLCLYHISKDPAMKYKSMHCGFIILVFAIGAAFGASCSAWFGVKAIWIAMAMQVVGFFMMFAHQDIEAFEKFEEEEKEKIRQTHARKK